ncbi:MAG: alcohol dehydrogenase catalytic domain-containing protein [Actinobacteria bacterium]|nr:alcohol dehydrogenase catalytic domain-containing protein [Actinomycetota bacterium]
MLQVRVHGPADVRVDQIAEPEPGPADALVRVAACGICGSDLSYIKMGGVAGPGPEPLCLGHEISGTVDWVGPEVDSVHVGDRVVVQAGSSEPISKYGSGGPFGGLTPLLCVTEPEQRLHVVPDHVALDVAAFAEPLAVGMHAVDQAEVQPGEGVVVFGCGPIGLGAVATLVDRGHERVVAVDLSATRRELALGLGAQAAFDPTTTDVWEELKSLHGTKPFMFGPTAGTAAFIEASGADQVILDVIDNAAVGARLSVVALHYRPIKVSFLTLLMKELTLRGSIEYPARFENSVDLLARRDLSALITHRFGLEQFDDALAVLDGSKDCGKVLIGVDPTQW